MDQAQAHLTTAGRPIGIRMEVLLLFVRPRSTVYGEWDKRCLSASVGWSTRGGIKGEELVRLSVEVQSLSPCLEIVRAALLFRSQVFFCCCIVLFDGSSWENFEN